MTKLKPYDVYKESGIDWVGPIPAGWETHPLFAVARENTASNKAGAESNLLSLSYGRIVRKDIAGNEGLLPASFDTYQVIRRNDIVLRLTDLQNDKRSLRSAISPERGIITSAYLAVTPTTIRPRFLSYLLRAYDLQKVFYSMGGGLRQSMKFSDMKRLSVIFPPESTQREIIAYLDRETAQIDDLIDKQERLIELLGEKRQAIITQAVTKGLDATATKPSGIPWLGDVPTHWDVSPLRYLLQEALKYGANESAEFDDPEWPRYLRITDFELNGALKNHTFRSLPPHIAAAYMVKPGDVLFARSGATVGKTFIVPEDSPSSCFAGYLIKASCDRDKLLPSFFVTYTKSSVFAEWKDASLTVATIQNIGADKLANLPVPVPPLAEQQEIMRQLQGRLSKLDVLMGKARECATLLRERRSALISAAVTGKIDVREGAA